MSEDVKILLVEDNEGDIVLTKEAFEDSGICSEIRVVRDGEKALNYLGKENEYTHEPTPDLILLDINIPKKNGHEVLKEIKSEDDLKHIPVIMLSTSSSREEIKKSYKNYANCYITKPDDVDSFYEAVQKIEAFWLNLTELPNLSN